MSFLPSLKPTLRSQVMGKRVIVLSHASPVYRKRIGKITDYQAKGKLALIEFEDSHWEWWAWVSLKGLKYT